MWHMVPRSRILRIADRPNAFLEQKYEVTRKGHETGDHSSEIAPDSKRWIASHPLLLPNLRREGENIHLRARFPSLHWPLLKNDPNLPKAKRGENWAPNDMPESSKWNFRGKRCPRSPARHYQVQPQHSNRVLRAAALMHWHSNQESFGGLHGWTIEAQAFKGNLLSVPEQGPVNSV